MKLNGPAVIVYSIALLLSQMGCAVITHAESYGTGLGSDGLANTPLGPQECKASYRFVAQHTGYVSQVRVYLIPDKSGYAAGTGGTIHVTVNPDDGTSAHRPTSTVLGGHWITNILALPSPSRYFYVAKFSPSPWLTAGRIYHVVFQNEDRLPAYNYLSVDALYHVKPTTPTQPTVSDASLAVLMSSQGGPWQPRPGFTPIYELDFANGNYQGVGYMEAWVGYPRIISGVHAVRETFTVSSNVSVSSAAVRISRIYGNNPLVVRLENANGTLVHSGSISALDIPASDEDSPTWTKLNFGASYTLLAGHTYHLVFEAPSTSLYETFPIRKGYKYGFRSSTYFPTGYAQFNLSGSWYGWTAWGQSNRTDGDLQFYFNVP